MRRNTVVCLIKNTFIIHNESIKPHDEVGGTALENNVQS